MRHALVIVPAILLALSSQTALSQDLPPVAVNIGGEPDLDACSSAGTVYGLNPQGDNFLAVRAGPGTNYAIRDRLNSGQQLSLCDERGNWLGVVYPREAGQDCGLGTPYARSQPYAGPCLSGWVHRRFVRVTAG